MKNLAEQIKELKEKENEAYKRYTDAVEREVNALLKRCGDSTGCSKWTMVSLHNEAVSKGHRIDICTPASLAYELVHRYESINKLLDKWLELSQELIEVEEIIKRK